MARQEFGRLAAGDDWAEPSLLRRVELIVLDSHRRLYASSGRPWSEAIAYHWLRYEDPEPVMRLAEGVRRLLSEGATINGDAVDKACAEARKGGFSN